MDIRNSFKRAFAVLVSLCIVYIFSLIILQADSSLYRKEEGLKNVNASLILGIAGEVERKSIYEIYNPTLSPPHVFPDFPFTFSMIDNMCGNGVEVVNIVNSEVELSVPRVLARETWAAPDIYKNTSIKTIFMVGLSSTLYYQRRLYLESKYFRDIVQVNIKDSSWNQTLKTLAALQWTRQFCPGAKWLVKTDSTTFLNPFAIQNYLKDVSADFVCRPNYNASVCRPGKCKRVEVELTEEEYEGEVLPRYCTGNAYIVNTMAIPELLKAHFSYEKYFHLEDIYFTGILPRNASYVDLEVQHFPLMPKAIFKHHYNGTALFLCDVDKTIGKGSTKTIWEMILDFRNPRDTKNNLFTYEDDNSRGDGHS